MLTARPFEPPEQNSLNSSSDQITLSDEFNFPTLKETAYYGLAGEIVRTIEPHTEAHPIGLLLSLFAAIGTALGNAVHWLIGGTAHPLRIHTILVGTTGKGRKGTSYGAINGVLKAGLGSEFVKQNVSSGLSSGEGLIFAVRDPVYKLERNMKNKQLEEVLIDEGVTDKRLIVLESEFGRVLKAMGREGNTLSAVLRQVWDMGQDDVLRVMTKNSTQATGAHIGIIGHITRDELLRYLEDTETANGFANRFLWAMVKRERLLPFGGYPDPETVYRLGHCLNDALEWANQQTNTVLSWSSDAVEAWKVLYPKLSEGESGLAGAVLSRSEAQVLRLAGLYAVLDKTLKVEAKHLYAALAVWDYCQTSVYHIFGRRTGDAIADTILEELQKQGTLTKTEIMRLFKNNEKLPRVTRAIELLVRDGKARVTKIEGKDGRKWDALEAVRYV